MYASTASESGMLRAAVLPPTGDCPHGPPWAWTPQLNGNQKSSPEIFGTEELVQAKCVVTVSSSPFFGGGTTWEGFLQHREGAGIFRGKQKQQKRHREEGRPSRLEHGSKFEFQLRSKDYSLDFLCNPALNHYQKLQLCHYSVR